MKFNVLINDNKLRQACQIVQHHCCDTEFLQMIQSEKSYNSTDSSPVAVAVELAGMKRLNVVVKYYRPWYLISSAISRWKTYGEYSGVIEYNKGKNISAYKLDDLVENIYHECCHGIGFKHNGNYVNEDTLNSVPYKASAIFVKYLKSIGVL